MVRTTDEATSPTVETPAGQRKEPAHANFKWVLLLSLALQIFDGQYSRKFYAGFDPSAYPVKSTATTNGERAGG